MPLNTTKRQTYLFIPLSNLNSVSMLSHASQTAEPYLVNFHDSHKPRPGLTGWLMKSGCTATLKRLKAKNSIRKEHYKYPMFQRLMDFETCFCPKTK